MTAVPDGETALDAASERSYDVVLLDVALGAGRPATTWRGCCASRRDVVPIIMLTALDSEADAVQGLEAGADDYVTKPFGLAELRSRIRAVLRRAQGRVVEGNLRVGPITLDRDLRRVTVEENPVRLTFSEFELLGCLMSRPGYALQPPGAAARDLGRLRLSRPARDRRPHPAPAREARSAPRGAEPDPHGPGTGLPLPRAMIRRALRGLRGRLLLAFVATSAVTLAVAAAITLSPLQERLRDGSATALQRRRRGHAPGVQRALAEAGENEDEDAGLRAEERPDCASSARATSSRPRSTCASAPAAPACWSPTRRSRIGSARRPRFLYDTDFQGDQTGALALAFRAPWRRRRPRFSSTTTNCASRCRSTTTARSPACSSPSAA